MPAGQIETAVTADGMPYVPGRWSVWRHGGRQNDRWRLVKEAAGELIPPAVRNAYRKAAESLRQGEVRLMAPDGRLAERCWSPRLRTRW